MAVVLERITAFQESAEITQHVGTGVILEPNQKLQSLLIGPQRLELADALAEPIQLETDMGMLTIEDFSSHPMHPNRRFGDMTEQSLIPAHPEQIVVTLEQDNNKSALILPRVFQDGSLVAKVDMSVIDGNSEFAISLYDIVNGDIIKIDPQKPDENARILHGTQILGHIKDGLEMQEFAHRQQSLDSWRFAFPPTKRRKINQNATSADGVPTEAVTTNWYYAGNELTYQDPDSFSSVVGFVAANAQLCRQVAAGEFGVVSTNFRGEGQLLKLINPDLLLGGISFTFLQGKPARHAEIHKDIPKLQQMIQRVQDSLDAAPATLGKLGIPEARVNDWWRISAEKMQDHDFVLYRTFFPSSDIPQSVGDTQVIDIPHPIPETQLDRNSSRQYIAQIIGKDISPEQKIVLLPGESNDGCFEKRLADVVELAIEDPNVLVITPLFVDDKRLANMPMPDNVHVIGYREDWQSITPGADVAFVRGSWGELLDVIAAGNVPVITSPGVVPTEGEIGDIQFLAEVSGERAANLSLFIMELQRNGVSSDTIEHLLADVLDEKATGETRRALEFALRDDVASEIRSGLAQIRRNGIEWMVRLHEQILMQRRTFASDELEQLHIEIWSNINYA